MKFLSPSPSSSPSSATTITTTTTDTGGSLTTMLRRLLCFNSLPTYPSDLVKHPEMSSIEVDKKGCFRTEYDGDKAEPGLVAKLMGLESMPNFDLANTQVKSHSISRSKSVDYDSKIEKESQHRRIKTSLSFSEFPTFLVLDDCFVLSFENAEEGKEIGSKSSRLEKEIRKSRRRRTERSRRRKREKQGIPEEMNKENRDPEEIKVRIIHKSSEKSNHEEHRFDQEKPGNEEEDDSVIKKIEETECNLENSSPVSVLDFLESTLGANVPISDEEERSTGSNSRRRLSEELENSQNLPPPPSSCNSTSDDEKDSKKTGRKSRRKKGCTRDYAEMWDQSCRLVEVDMMESNWRYTKSRRHRENSDDIGVECELQILDNLLLELVDQLVDGSSY